MNRLILFILALAAVTAIPAAAADASGATRRERALIKEGNALFDARKYHEALKCYDDAITLNPASAVAQYNRAVALVQLATDDNKGTDNDPRKAAAQQFEDVARADSRADLTASSFYNLGNMAFNDEQYDRAIEMYKSSLRKIPDNRRARQNLLLAMQKKQEQEQNQDKQDQDKQEQQLEQQQPEQPKPMTQSAEQILQTMQNKENATRRKVNDREPQPAGRPTTDKPW